MAQIKVSKKQKVIRIVIFVLFLLFGIVQLNDPDPVLWCTIYGITAILALISIYKTIPKYLLWVILIALLVYSFQYVEFIMDWLHTDTKHEIFGEMVYEKPYLEGTREFLGLMMSASVMVYLLKSN